jgi:hypothetical protein
MDRRRILRLADVLVASQMRSGRSSSTPGEFWGRPMALGVLDVFVFLLALGVGSQAIGFLAGTDPRSFATLAPQVMAFLPLLVLGAVLLAGVLFELSQSSRFAASDAANWLPITPVEYVAASSIAATFVYSITAALSLGIAVAVTWYTGDLAGLLLASGLIVLTLFEGGVLVEMLRASTQRISSVVSRRTGRATIVLRLALSVLIILAFELGFNPVILYGALQTVSGTNGWALAIPFLWPSHALLSYFQGDLLGSAVFGTASVGIVLGFVAAAAELRVRFWAPTAAELDLGTYRYAPSHPWMAALGLTNGESSLVWKDLKGLVRRRELIPLLVVPVVITIITFVSSNAQGDSGGSLGDGVLAAWTPGLFALLLATTCIGQERRAIQTLYALPITAKDVFRAKSFSVLLPTLGFALVLWVVVGLVLPHTALLSLGLLVLMPTVTAVACFLGLTFATRYSDFQERPRARFLTPSAMIGSIFLGLGLVFAISLPTLLWLYAPSANVLPLALSAAIAALSLAITFRLARVGTDTLLRAVPI